MSDCEHCPDGHRRPNSRAMSVWVGPERDHDGQPTTLHVTYAAGYHVSENEAEYLRRLLNPDRAPRSAEPETMTARERLAADTEAFQAYSEGLRRMEDEEPYEDHDQMREDVERARRAMECSWLSVQMGLEPGA